MSIMKLKCKAIQRFISDYIDKALSDHDTKKVEVHIQSCKKCQNEFKALKRTRDLIVDFYVEPKVPDRYYHQFEVEFQRSIENRGPTPLNERLKTSIVQLSWSLLTRLRQCFGRYSLIRMNALPLGVLFLLIVTGFVATHLLKQDESFPNKIYPQSVNEKMVESELTTDEELTKLRQGIYYDSKIKRKAPNEVSSPTLAADTEKIGYWKLEKPLTTDTEGHIIVMHVSSDRSVPSDANDSELIVYAQPDILGRKSPLQENSDYAALPLGLQVAPFLEKYERKQRKLPRYIDKLMNVPVKILNISESYDFSKL